MTTPTHPIAPSRPEAVRKELARLNMAVVRCTDQAKCDLMEAKIAEIEEKYAE